MEHKFKTNRRNDDEEMRCEPRKRAYFFGFIQHITNTWTNGRTGSGRTGLYNIQLIVVSNINKNNFLYTHAAVYSFIVIYCMMCTFRVMISPIF